MGPFLARLAAAMVVAAALCSGVAVGQGGAPRSADRRAELAPYLAGLAAPAALERAAAERALAERLQAGDGEVLLEAAQHPSAEVRARLASALSSHARHLGLAVRLSRAQGPASDVGRAAILGQLAAWHPGLSRPSLVRQELDGRLSELARGRRSLPMAIPDGLDPRDALGLLERRAGLGIPLIVDPELARAAPFPGVVGLSGSWRHLLGRLAAFPGLGMDGALADPENPADPPRLLWLRLVRSPAAGRESGSEQLLGWLAALDRPEPEVAAAAAEALALSGWPAALELLAQRYSHQGDGAARRGLLKAAASRRVHPVLASEASLSDLIRQLDRALAADGGAADAGRIARALAGFGPLLPTGAPVAQSLVAGFGAAAPSGRLARLAILRLGAPSSAWVGPLLEQVLTAPPKAHGPALLLEAAALRASLFPSPQPLVLGAPAELIGAPQRLEEALELARWAAAGRLRLPAAWTRKGPETSGLTPLGQALAVDLLLGAGEFGAAADHAAGLLSGSPWAGAVDLLGPFLEEWRRGGSPGPPKALLAALEERLADPLRPRTLALAAGLLDPALHGPVSEALLAAGDTGGASPARWADLLAGPQGVPARAELLARLRAEALGGSREVSRWRALLERGERRLLEAGLDREANELRFAVRALVRELPAGAPLRALLASAGSPTAPEPRDLALEERGLPAGFFLGPPARESR